MQAKTLKSKNELRLTEPRKRVLKYLTRSKKPVKAYDIVEGLGDAKPMTVYRALDFLTQNGLAHRIESLNAYVPCQENHCAHRDSQYLICDGCGGVEELHNHAIDDFIAQALAKTGFRVQAKKIEINGLCKNCGP